MLNSAGGGMHHSLLSPGTKDFTHFHFAYKVNALLKPKLGGAGVSNDWCITSWENSGDAISRVASRGLKWENKMYKLKRSIVNAF